MTEKLEQQMTVMKNYLENAEKELISLKGGKKASAARVRKQLQALKTESHLMRKNIMEHTKAMPVKPRVKKESKETVEEESKETIEETMPPAPVLKREMTSTPVKKTRTVRKKKTETTPS